MLLANFKLKPLYTWNKQRKLKLTSAFMAPALKLCGCWGLFSLDMYTMVGNRHPSLSAAFVSLPSLIIFNRNQRQSNETNTGLTKTDKLRSIHSRILYLHN